MKAFQAKWLEQILQSFQQHKKEKCEKSISTCKKIKILNSEDYRGGLKTVEKVTGLTSQPRQLLFELYIFKKHLDLFRMLASVFETKIKIIAKSK